jgi:hypothetical protein
MTRLAPKQRTLLLAFVLALTAAAVFVVSRINQEMVGETMAWGTLFAIATITYVILDARPGWVLSGAALIAAIVALAAPLSLLSYYVSATFAYANINTLLPIGLWGVGALIGVGILAVLRAAVRRSQHN